MLNAIITLYRDINKFQDLLLNFEIILREVIIVNIMLPITILNNM